MTCQTQGWTVYGNFAEEREKKRFYQRLVGLNYFQMIVLSSLQNIISLHLGNQFSWMKAYWIHLELVSRFPMGARRRNGHETRFDNYSTFSGTTYTTYVTQDRAAKLWNYQAKKFRFKTFILTRENSTCDFTSTSLLAFVDNNLLETKIWQRIAITHICTRRLSARGARGYRGHGLRGRR